MALLSWLSMKGKSAHTSKRRIAVLAIFCLYSCSNAMQWMTYAPVQSQSKYYFNLTTDQLNYLSTIYMLVYIALAVFSCVGLERIGLRWCLLLGTGLNFAGALLKVVLGFPASSFAKIFVAQVLNSLSQIFVLSVPPSLATVWFPEKERATATALGSVANALGSALGMLIPPLIVKGIAGLGDDGDDTNSYRKTITTTTMFLGDVVSTSASALSTSSELSSGFMTNTTNTQLTTTLLTTITTTASPPSGPDLSSTGQQFLNLFIMQLVLCTVAFVGVLLLVPYEDGAVEEEDKDPEEDRRKGASNVSAVVGGEGQISLLAGDTSPEGTASTLSTISATSSGANEGTHLLAPTTARNEEQQQQQQDEDPSVAFVFVSIIKVLKDRNACLLIIALSISVGSVWAVNSMLAQLLAPINISEGDAGQMGFWNIIGGTIVAIISGWLVDRYRVYKWPLFGLALCNLICLSLLILIIYLDVTPIGADVNTNSLIGTYVVVIIAGIPQNVITPVGFEFLMELTYGYPDSISGGLLMALANAISLILVTVGSLLLGDATVAPKPNALNCFWLVWGSCLFGCALMALPRNRLLRYEAQKAREAERLALIQ